MTSMKRRLTGKTMMTIISALLILVVAVPAVSAFEAHALNVTVRVEQPDYPTLYKTMRFATDDEIVEFLDLIDNMDPPAVNFPSGTPNVGVDNATNVPMNTFILWVVTIFVNNNDDEEENCWTDLIIKDNFSAELGGVILGDEVIDLFIKTHSRGKKPTKEIFETQYRITWYVTWDDTVEPPDNLDTFCPGASAFAQLYVWTKLNPAGHQEYTSPGTYTMNSGPTAKWYKDGQQFSFDGESLYITVYP